MAAAFLRLSLLRPSASLRPFSSSLHSNPNHNFTLKTPLSLSKPLPPLSLSSSSSSAPIPSLSSDLPPPPPPPPPHSGGGNGGGNSGDGDHSESNDDRSDESGSDPISGFIQGWKSRVSADPQFPFKVLMEELVGVTACVLGDMASRPNFGLNELDFVFSTLVVGSILNFVLMYLLAPTSSSVQSTLPGIFANSPTSHMFQPGGFTIPQRLGTFVYKGATFAGVGFFAGLAGTALSNGLIKLRKKMDPSFETPNKAPPTLLNAFTWALHMGVSSNLRYQSLNGVEYVLAKAVPAAVFKGSVVVLRCLNNVLGGMSFVVLARLTGSQKVDGGTVPVPVPVRESESEGKSE